MFWFATLMVCVVAGESPSPVPTKLKLVLAMVFEVALRSAVLESDRSPFKFKVPFPPLTLFMSKVPPLRDISPSMFKVAVFEAVSPKTTVPADCT